VDRRRPSAREDQFLGAMLGFAIGDALGRPLVGLTADEVAARFDRLDAYGLEHDGDEPDELGEITGISEVMLCIVESITTNAGMIDPENINARLAYLIRGPARDWMSDATVEGIELAGARDGLVDEGYAPPSEFAVALRGVPVGLLHAVGGFDPGIMASDASLVARLSHGSAEQAIGVNHVASIVQDAARTRHIPSPGERTPGASDLPSATVFDILGRIGTSATFEEGVSQVIARGGPSNLEGALAGAVLGAAGGASAIPQHLIDGLDARIYLSLAAPWFFRAAQRRAGTVIDLRVVDSDG